MYNIYIHDAYILNIYIYTSSRYVQLKHIKKFMLCVYTLILGRQHRREYCSWIRSTMRNIAPSLGAAEA